MIIGQVKSFPYGEFWRNERARSRPGAMAASLCASGICGLPHDASPAFLSMSDPGILQAGPRDLDDRRSHFQTPHRRRALKLIQFDRAVRIAVCRCVAPVLACHLAATRACKHDPAVSFAKHASENELRPASLGGVFAMMKAPVICSTGWNRI